MRIAVEAIELFLILLFFLCLPNIRLVVKGARTVNRGKRAGVMVTCAGGVLLGLYFLLDRDSRIAHCFLGMGGSAVVSGFLTWYLAQGSNVEGRPVMRYRPVLRSDHEAVCHLALTNKQEKRILMFCSARDSVSVGELGTEFGKIKRKSLRMAVAKLCAWGLLVSASGSTEEKIRYRVPSVIRAKLSGP